MAIRIKADFNGLFGDLLCLSHAAFGTTDTGEGYELAEGDFVAAFEPDVGEDGRPAYLVATGTVVLSPPELCAGGSVWSLVIDKQGVRYVATLDDV